MKWRINRMPWQETQITTDAVASEAVKIPILERKQSVLEADREAIVSYGLPTPERIVCLKVVEV